MRKCLIITTNGKIWSRPKAATEDGVAVTAKKTRQKWLIRAPPFTYTKTTGPFSKQAYNLYLCHLNSTTTVSLTKNEKWWKRGAKPETVKGAPTYDGETIGVPNIQSLGTDTDLNGDNYDYVITPEHLYERSDSADLLAMNLASKLPWPIIFLAMGAGGGLFLIIALGLMAAGKLHIG